MNLIERKNYFAPMDLLHPAEANKRGIQTEVPILLLQKTNELAIVGATISTSALDLEEIDPQHGFSAILTPELSIGTARVAGIKVGCIDYVGHPRNPMYLNSQGRKETIQEGFLISRFSLPESGILIPICDKYHQQNNYAREFSFQINPQGEIEFTKIKN